ncbi:restriction endonuclease subunit S [Enterococcus faecalis]|uniref:restriction endonuclease subunit S n=1 Tax=Enterococcus faecalis TaxID=1351 RepID=UPI00215B8AB8|nr:restriction endonuclease subunit S [Enterococcus faecalis]
MSKKSPQLRFEGFTDDWEERKLGELTTSFSGGTPSAGNSSYYKGDIPFIRSGEINSDKTELFLTEAGLKSSSAKMVSVGDILYALYGATSGEVGISQINGAINQAILAIKPCDGYNSHFLMQWLKLQKQKIIDKYLQGGQGNLSGSIVKNLVLKVPNFEEQKKIGAFFKQLDDTITLHQRKLDLLKEQKKGYLQKMFPKNGAKVPELRFAGFVDDWEQRKLSDLMTFSNGINAPKENYGKGTKMISVMDILNPLPIKYDNILNSVSVDKKIEDKNKVENGDLIFVRSSEIVEEVGWAKAYKEARYALYSGFAIRGKRISSYNAYFIELTLNYANRKEIKRRAGGSTRFNVSQEILNSLTVLTPSISEQNQIDLFFTKIDDTITLHQRKLDLLKEQKKGFLQKMFV